MADYTYCFVELGGNISVRAMEALAEAVDMDRVDDIGGFDDHDNVNRSFAEALVEAERRKTSIAFSGAEVSGGYPDAVVDVCARYGIIYRITTAERYDIPNRVLYFDGTDEHKCEATSDREAAITLGDLRAALNAGSSLEQVIDTYKVFVNDLPPVELVP